MSTPDNNLPESTFRKYVQMLKNQSVKLAPAARRLLETVRDLFRKSAEKANEYYEKLPLDAINSKLGGKVDVKSGKFKKGLAVAAGIIILLVLWQPGTSSDSIDYDDLIDSVPDCECVIINKAEKYDNPDQLLPKHLDDCAVVGDMDGVKHIVEKYYDEDDVSPEVRAQDFAEALEAAIENDHLDIAEYLLDMGTKPELFRWIRLLEDSIESEFGNCKRVKFILKHSGLASTYSKYYKQYDKYFDDDVPHSDRIEWPLYQALWKLRPCVIKTLLDYGFLQGKNDPAIAHVNLSRGCKYGFMGKNGFCEEDYLPRRLKVLKMLIDYGADPNVPFKGKQTQYTLADQVAGRYFSSSKVAGRYVSSFCANRKEHYDGTIILAFLRDHGAKFTLTAESFPEVSEETLIKNSDSLLKDYPEIRKERLNELLSRYCYDEKKQPEKIAALIQAGADPNIKISDRQLLEDALTGNSEIAVVLLQNGADPNLLPDRIIRTLSPDTEPDRLAIQKLSPENRRKFFPNAE